MEKGSFLNDESISSSFEKYFSESDNESNDEEISESDSFLSQPLYNFEVDCDKYLQSSSRNSSCYESTFKTYQNSQINEQIGYLDTDIPLISEYSTESSSQESETESQSDANSSQTQSSENSIEKTKESSYDSYSYGSNYMSIYISTEA